MPLRRTIYQVELLSNSEDYTAGFDPANMSLQEIAHEITAGGMSGTVNCLSNEELSPESMAYALREQGSDPELLLGEDWEEERPVVDRVAEETGTDPEHWEGTDGPDSGHGVDYYFRNERTGQTAYVNNDQGDFTISITNDEEDDEG